MERTRLKELRAKIQRYIASRDPPPSRCEICRTFGVSWNFVASLLNEPNCEEIWSRKDTVVNPQKGSTD
jgi:hypothetical protein